MFLLTKAHSLLSFWFLSSVLFLGPGSSSGPHMTFSRHTSLSYSCLGLVFHTLPCFLMNIWFSQQDP